MSILIDSLLFRTPGGNTRQVPHGSLDKTQYLKVLSQIVYVGAKVFEVKAKLPWCLPWQP